jgi:CRP-like cAMP-binding protein
MSAELLEHIHAHANINQEEAEIILAAFKPKTVRKHENILRAGEVCRHETFIVSGCFKKSYTDSMGTEHVASFGVENWYVGDFYSYLSEKPSIYNITALEDSQILQIFKPDLEHLLDTIRGMERYYRILFQNAYVSLQSRAMDQISATAEERYHTFLKRYPGYQNRVPQYLIASYLGISPQFLSKIRKRSARKRID